LTLRIVIFRRAFDSDVHDGPMGDSNHFSFDHSIHFTYQYSMTKHYIYIITPRHLIQFINRLLRDSNLKRGVSSDIDC
jgi:hypothetical protein